MMMTKKSAVVLGLSLSLAVALPGCHGMGFLEGLAKVAQASQSVASLVDVAEAGAKAWLARHPNDDVEARVAGALRDVRTAIYALDRAVAAGEAVDEARAEVLRAYGALRSVIEDTGILEGKPPAGGAETEAPVPGPLDLPTVRELAEVL